MPKAASPASRFDATAQFSDMQWFMFRQRNVVHYGAFSRRAYDAAGLIEVAHTLVTLAPQLLTAFAGAGQTLPPEAFARLVEIRPVAGFDGFPDAVIDDGAAVLADPGLPLFRLRAFVREGGADAEGRAAFLLVRVAHALVEGADSALLSRSQGAAHPVSVSAQRLAPWLAVAAAGLGLLAALAHLLVGNLYVPHPGPFLTVSRAVPRRAVSDMARTLGISQRALCFALVMATLFGAGTPAGKRRISATYSTIDNGGGARRDNFMRMRMLVGRFANAGDFAGFAQGVDRRLSHGEARESGFNAEFSAAGLHAHRRLSQVFPFAYRPQLFGFLPYDIVLGLLPPHRLGGTLARDLMEPVFAGATTPGANACVVVPGRQLFTFNFYIEQRLQPNLVAFAALLPDAAVKPGFSAPTT